MQLLLQTPGHTHTIQRYACGSRLSSVFENAGVEMPFPDVQQLAGDIASGDLLDSFSKEQLAADAGSDAHM